MSTTRFGFRRLLPLFAALMLAVPVLLVFAEPVAAQTTWYVDNTEPCPGVGTQSNPFCSIGLAVLAANPNDTIYVYPGTGTYNEHVNLNNMAVDGNITLTTPGPTLVNGGATGEAFSCGPAFPGGVTIDGFTALSPSTHGIHLDLTGTAIVRNVIASGNRWRGIEVVSTNANVVIRNCTANQNGDDGIAVYGSPRNVTINNCRARNNTGANVDGIVVDDAQGTVTITDCTASNNSLDGMRVVRPTGSVTIDGCTTSGNGNRGLNIKNTPGNVTISGVTANGNSQGITVDNDEIGGNINATGCTASNNHAGNGIRISGAGVVTVANATADGNDSTGIGVYTSGKTTIANCAASQNGSSGFSVNEGSSDMLINACVAQGNEYGVYIRNMPTGAALEVTGSIICGSTVEGLHVSSGPVSVDATGNWWGCPEGPNSPPCDYIDPDSATVDSTPWIDTVSASVTVDPATAGEPTVVSFQFSDTSVYLGEGPGDLHGTAPFIVTTDNGTVTGGGFINEPNGVLSVTLVPDTSGAATVTVDGPCGIEDLDGTTIEVDVLEPAAEEEFVPEPGTVLLLASGLAGLAGYAGLRLRRR
jgi:parallel beta-helix repeat protein